jgi:transketolase
MMETNRDLWTKLAAQLRIDSIRCTTAAGSGHPTSSMSAADLMAVLLTDHLRYDWDSPELPNNDSLIFSKGHACPLLYSAYKAVGAVSDEELLTLRKLGSRLEGHPTPDIPWVEAATGSLGQGLSVGVGDALAAKYLDKLPFRVWVILGDSEMAEGSVWEAFATASEYKLNNIVAIIDVNRLGQRGETMLGWNTGVYADRARAFGWNAIEIDGHNLDEISRAFKEAEASDKPTAIVARTKKGAGASLTADQSNWHGKALPAEEAEKAIAEIKQAAGIEGDSNIVIDTLKPEAGENSITAAQEVELPTYPLGEKVAARKAYGDALKAVGAADNAVVALDAEVSNSTYSEFFGKAYPDRFFEMFIAEQQMVSSAVGLQNRLRKPYCSTFAAFYSRAYDQIRMAAISQADIKFCGSHAGVSIGEDGPSQMALEDLAMFRAVHGSTVLYPSDATSTAALVAAMKDLKGISFIRTTREATPVLYEASESFPLGGSKTHGDGTDATIIGAGITLHEGLKAAEQLKAEGINVRVIDLYSLKPVDVATLKKAAQETEKIVVVEDHWREGGLGDTVLAALAEAGVAAKSFKHLCVSKMPRSGPAMALLEDNGISTKDIVAIVKG